MQLTSSIAVLFLATVIAASPRNARSRLRRRGGSGLGFSSSADTDGSTSDPAGEAATKHTGFPFGESTSTTASEALATTFGSSGDGPDSGFPVPTGSAGSASSGDPWAIGYGNPASGIDSVWASELSSIPGETPFTDLPGVSSGGGAFDGSYGSEAAGGVANCQFATITTTVSAPAKTVFVIVSEVGDKINLVPELAAVLDADGAGVGAGSDNHGWQKGSDRPLGKPVSCDENGQHRHGPSPGIPGEGNGNGNGNRHHGGGSAHGGGGGELPGLTGGFPEGDSSSGSTGSGFPKFGGGDGGGRSSSTENAGGSTTASYSPSFSGGSSARTPFKDGFPAPGIDRGSDGSIFPLDEGEFPATQIPASGESAKRSDGSALVFQKR